MDSDYFDVCESAYLHCCELLRRSHLCTALPLRYRWIVGTFRRSFPIYRVNAAHTDSTRTRHVLHWWVHWMLLLYSSASIVPYSKVIFRRFTFSDRCSVDDLSLTSLFCCERREPRGKGAAPRHGSIHYLMVIYDQLQTDTLHLSAMHIFVIYIRQEKMLHTMLETSAFWNH